MKKAFTLIELLVVISIIAILAALLMPALAGARRQAVASNCRGNLRNQGLAMSMLLNDRDHRYPGWVGYDAVDDAHEGVYLGEANGMEPERWVEPVEKWALLLEYTESIDVFADPAWTMGEHGPWGNPVFTEDPSRSPGDAPPSVVNVEYLHDFGRIDMNSRPGRVITGCAPRLQNYDTGELLEHAHAEGSNVLFVDGATQMAPRQHPQAIWSINAMGGIHAFLDGYTPNPRLHQSAYLATDEEQRALWEATHLHDVYSHQVVEDQWWAHPSGGPDTSDPAPYGATWDRDWRRADAIEEYRDTGSADWAPEAGPGHYFSPWATTENNQSPWRFARANRPAYLYEQRGIFATEPRWNRYDTRLAPTTPYGDLSAAGTRFAPVPDF